MRMAIRLRLAFSLKLAIPGRVNPPALAVGAKTNDTDVLRASISPAQLKSASGADVRITAMGRRGKKDDLLRHSIPSVVFVVLIVVLEVFFFIIIVEVVVFIVKLEVVFFVFVVVIVVIVIG